MIRWVIEHMWGQKKEAKRLAEEARAATINAEPQHAHAEALGEELTEIRNQNHFTRNIRRALS